MKKNGNRESLQDKLKKEKKEMIFIIAQHCATIEKNVSTLKII